MKKLIFALSLIIASSSLAAELESIRCEKDGMTLGLGISSIGGRGKGSIKVPVMVLVQGQQTVGSLNAKLNFEGYEDSLLNAYLWTFESTDGSSGILGVAVPDLKELVVGEYQAFADAFVDIDGVVFNGSTVPCTVKIK